MAARKAGIQLDRPVRIVHEIPFEAERKLMSVVVQGEGDSPVMYVKGAPEVVLDRCAAELVDGTSPPAGPSTAPAARSAVRGKGRRSFARAGDCHEDRVAAARRRDRNGPHVARPGRDEGSTS